jgi:hypothetical protein
MFTPVRIRGKKRRVRQPASEEISPQPFCSSSELVSGPQGRPLSPLERLPVELLQTVFILCRNLNLPRASSYLGTVLASDHLKEELVLYAFDYTLGHFKCSADLLELRSALLRQKWLTYALFRHCQKKSLLEHAIQFYCRHKSSISTDTRSSEIESIKAFFDNAFDHSLRTLNLTGLIKNWAEDPSSHVMNPWRKYRRIDINEVSFHIEMEDDGPVFMRCETTSEGVLTSWPIRVECKIPEKLLHGPWTNERGQFLYHLLRRRASVDWINSTGGEVAQTGLKDAIRENNLCAIDTLVKRLQLACFGTKDMFERYLTSKLGMIRNGQITDLFNPQSPWVFWPKHLEPMYTVGVQVTTEHLKIAVLEKGCDPKIVNGLTAYTIDTLIDCDDKELLKWAGERIEEAEGEISNQEGEQMSLGSFLLKILNKVRDRQLRYQQMRARVQGETTVDQSFIAS